ncbi:MAG TPA: D-alanyl-D-alanine carboxypeptidase/D-alanyl-D-alanine-endopeptidase [Chloroflexota bacterium]|jgi:D-alanyl-D-alanine carboxypeptidase/D-alanyl-D-alanine-endopeptidase (penicillin-binding protein 4)
MRPGEDSALADTPLRLTRRAVLRASALAGGAAVALGLAPWGRGAAAARPAPADDCAAAGSLPNAITAVMQKPRYANATWNLLAVDLATGETLYEVRPDEMAFTGSVRKLFSVGLALKQLGADYRFTTPVYRRGTIDAQGVLQGDLILVAAGDLTLGGRLNADSTIAFTDFDHNDANNLGTAILTPQDPLYGLDSLAQQVQAAGIRNVAGEVIVDDRLFDSFRVPNQNLLVTPIMVNENMVDVTVAPTQPGQAASLVWRPHTEAFAVDGSVTTTAAGTPETVSLSDGGLIECIGTAGCAGTVTGNIPLGYQAPLSGSPILVQTFRVEDPAAFARTAFVEALQRAGVAVATPAVAQNPRALLPAPGAYAPDTRVAAFVSPPYSEYAKLILKVSLNLGANLSLMLFGLARGQRTIADALAVERQTLVDEMGIRPDQFDFPTNGSGSPDSQAAPRATVRMLTEMAGSAVAQAYQAALPVLGVDGSLAESGTRLPARGHVFAKTGTTIADGALKAQNLAGYIEARSGRRLAFAVYVNDAGPIQRIDDVAEVFEDEATITNAIYEAC